MCFWKATARAMPKDDAKLEVYFPKKNLAAQKKQFETVFPTYAYVWQKKFLDVQKLSILKFFTDFCLLVSNSQYL